MDTVGFWGTIISVVLFLWNKSWTAKEDIVIEITDHIPNIGTCGKITVSAKGSAERKHPKCLGTYKLTDDEYCSGRRIYKHNKNNRVLMVRNGGVSWCVRENVHSDTAYLRSGCAPSLCPGSKLNERNKRLGRTSWQYKDGLVWKDGDISVKCSVHPP